MCESHSALSERPRSEKDFDLIWMQMVSYTRISFPKTMSHLESYQSTSKGIVLRGCLAHFLRYSWTQHHPKNRSFKKVQTLPFLTITLLNHLLIIDLIHNLILGYHHKHHCTMGGHSSLIVHILYISGVFCPFSCMLSSLVLSHPFFIKICLTRYYRPCLLMGKEHKTSFSPLMSRGSRISMHLLWYFCSKLLYGCCSLPTIFF